MDAIGSITPFLIGIAVFILLISYYLQIEAWALNRYKRRNEWIKQMLERLFLRNDEKMVLGLSFMFPLGATLFVFILGILLAGSFLVGLMMSFFVSVVSWFLPILAIKFLYRQRIKKFDLQLTDALTLMGSSLKAGLSFLQALQVMVDELPIPCGQEFKIMLAEHRLGATIEESMLSMTRRIPSRDLDIMVNAIIILRETGGDLTETFDTLYTTIIGRRKVEGKIEALTSMGMSQAVVLTALPIVLGAGFFFMDPEGFGRMFTTPIGLVLVAVGLLLAGVGGYAITKIIKIDV